MIRIKKPFTLVLLGVTGLLEGLIFLLLSAITGNLISLVLADAFMAFGFASFILWKIAKRQ
jgi:hypothetical protein